MYKYLRMKLLVKLGELMDLVVKMLLSRIQKLITIGPWMELED